MSLILSNIGATKTNPILESNNLFLRSKSKEKINLSLGIIVNGDGVYHSFESINEAEKIVIETYKDKPYNISNGSKEFSALTQELVFGKNSKYMIEKKICSIQTIGGTGSIFIMLEVLKRLNIKNVYLTDVYYEEHIHTIEACCLIPKYLDFYDNDLMDINYEKFLTDLRDIEDCSCIILQICAMNPCGTNIKEEYYDKIADIVLEKNHFVIFDLAYIGFGSSDLDKDCLLVRRFEERGIYFSVCLTFSKIMSLYGSRAGVLHVICKNKHNRKLLADNIFDIVSARYGTPSIEVTRIICEVLRNEKLKSAWIKDLYELSEQINDKRLLFIERLQFHQKKYNLNHNWNIYKKQKGLFFYSPITGKICEKLRVYNIYMVNSGRINISGITKDNVDHIADTICFCLSELYVKKKD